MKRDPRVIDMEREEAIALARLQGIAEGEERAIEAIVEWMTDSDSEWGEVDCFMSPDDVRAGVRARLKGRSG